MQNKNVITQEEFSELVQQSESNLIQLTGDFEVNDADDMGFEMTPEPDDLLEGRATFNDNFESRLGNRKKL